MTSSTHPLQASAAFTKVFDQHHIAVFRFIYGFSGASLYEVEDLTAETFFKAWKSWGSFEGDSQSALKWLITIARHLVIDYSRRKKVRKFEQNTADLDDLHEYLSDEHSENPEKQIIHHQQATAMLHQLSLLDPESRELLVLRYILGWQVKQIAAHLGRHENTVSVYIHRTIEQIRENWLGDDV